MAQSWKVKHIRLFRYIPEQVTLYIIVFEDNANGIWFATKDCLRCSNLKELSINTNHVTDQIFPDAGFEKILGSEPIYKNTFAKDLGNCIELDFHNSGDFEKFKKIK